MICNKCKQIIEDDSVFCRFCGKKIKKEASPKRRGNGMGTVVKVANGYKATVTLSYYIDSDGKPKRKTRSKTYPTKTEAVRSLATLANEPQKTKTRLLTFAELYEKWLPTHRAGKSTIDCYKAAFKYFYPVHDMLMSDIDVDDLQECVDECPHGKRTQQNMKAMCGLVYKYGIPRNAVPNNLNLAQYLILERSSTGHRDSFTDEQIELIKEQIGSVYGADYVYCLIYLGFRPSEFLSLNKESYNLKENYVIGGSKTEAGTNRIVTVSPKIQPYMHDIYNRCQNALICDVNQRPYNLKAFTENVFYEVLKAARIDNPMVKDENGNQRHKYTPHSCRHTFSTLMKNTSGADKDKLELIGHTSTEMLRYYQDVSLSDLRKITDNI